MPKLTVRNIMDAETLFRASIAGDIVMLTFDVIVGVALFMLFRATSPGLSILATAFRIVHAAVYGATLLTLLVIVAIVGGSSELTAGETALVQSFADVHALGYSLALIFFAVSLAMVGYLALKSGAVPGLIGVLLMFAGDGYMLDSFAQILLSNYADYEDILGVVVFFARGDRRALFRPLASRQGHGRPGGVFGPHAHTGHRSRLSRQGRLACEPSSL